MRRRLLIIVTVVAILAVVGLLVWLWFGSPATTTPQPAAPVTNQPVEPVNAPPVTTPAPAPTDPALGWRVLAMNFAERYGTYTSDLPFQNLKSLSTILTPEFAQRIQAQLASSTPPAGFYSVTTHALVATASAVTQDSVHVSVATQRSERFSRDEAPRLSYPTLEVTLRQLAGDWLVDSATWVK